MKRLFRGINIPLIYEQFDNNSHYQIVAVAANDAQIFQTRQRAPFKIILECVDINEIVEETEHSLPFADESTTDASIMTTKPRDLYDVVEVLCESPEAPSASYIEEQKY